MAEAPAIVAVDDEAYQRRVLVEFLARNGLRATVLRQSE
jgi:DNA-binding NtrC family response regulator